MNAITVEALRNQWNKNFWQICTCTASVGKNKNIYTWYQEWEKGVQMSLQARPIRASLFNKGWFQGELWTSSPTQFDPSVTLLNRVKVYNAVCTPTPIHRLCTQTFSPPQKTNTLLGIEPASPPPSRSPSRDVRATCHHQGLLSSSLKNNNDKL